jgi:hypothetical protein
LVLWYIGEPGGYGTWGRNRQVFNSDAAAPVIIRIFKHGDTKMSDAIDRLRKDKEVSHKLTNKYILKRFENLLDYSE